MLRATLFSFFRDACTSECHSHEEASLTWYLITLLLFSSSFDVLSAGDAPVVMRTYL